MSAVEAARSEGDSDTQHLKAESMQINERLLNICRRPEFPVARICSNDSRLLFFERQSLEKQCAKETHVVFT